MSNQDSNLLIVLSDRINELIEENKLDEAEKIAHSSLETARRRAKDDGKQKESLIFILEQYASILNHQEKFSEAEMAYLEALDLCKSNKIPLIQNARLLSSLAFLYEVTDEIDNAINYYQQAVEIYKRCNPIAYEDLANMHNNLGMLLKLKKNYDKAEEHYLLSLDIYEHQIGLKSEEAGTVYNNLGCLYQDVGYFEQSKDMHQEALTIRADLYRSEEAHV